MPRGNGLGPNGLGPMTGRGAGYCAGYNNPSTMSFGRGMGFRRGQRAVMQTTLSPENEKAFLQKRVEILNFELETSNMRLAELNKAPQES